MNEFGWPYIGPCVKDCENKIATTCEAIVTGETISYYAWVIEMMVEMEPRWLLSSLKLIFADNFITDQLLSLLGINETCTLRCDHYHLINEVWPTATSFGETILAKVKNNLLQMLTGRTKKIWDNAYSTACNILKTNPRKKKKLEDIYNRPTYYSGYHLMSIEGNRGHRGSTPAEINHASIVAYFGKGNNWSIMEQINELMKRHQNHEKIRERDKQRL